MLVSIIMPYYKKKSYIKDTVLSVLSQTYKKFELLIIYDDENKDDLSYIKEISKLSDKIKIIINDHNYGAGRSRNIGIRNSKGSYVAFIDADDIWKDNKLNYQINYMQMNKIDISFTAYDIIDYKSKKIGSRSAKVTLSFRDLIKSCDIGLSTVIIKKSLLQNSFAFEFLKTKEDYALWLKLTKKGYIFHGIDIPLTQWRKLDKSLSSNIYQKLIDGFRVYNNYMNYSKLTSLIYLLRLSFYYLLKK